MPFSATTLIDADLLRAQIREIRARGYAISVNERGAGGVGISAPIFNHEGGIVAALAIGAPVSRYTSEVEAACVAAALEAARGISAALGYHPVRFTASWVGRLSRRTLRAAIRLTHLLGRFEQWPRWSLTHPLNPRRRLL